MPLINDGYGCIEEMANPLAGKATLSWRPLSPLNDRDGNASAVRADWAEGDSDWASQKWFTIEAKEWSNDNKPPFCWFVVTRPIYYSRLSSYVPVVVPTLLLHTALAAVETPDPPNVGTTFYLIVAPGVKITEHKLTIPKGFAKPNFDVVRLDSIQELPAPGQNADLGQYLGERSVLEYFDGTGAFQTGFYDQARRDPQNGIASTIPNVYVLRTPRTIIFTNRWEHYRIKIELSQFEPSFFRIMLDRADIVPRYSPTEGREVGEAKFRFRVLHNEHTKVTFEADWAIKNDLQVRTAELRTELVKYVPERGTRIISPMFKVNTTTPTWAPITMDDNFQDLDAIQPKGSVHTKPDNEDLFENMRFKTFNFFTTTAIGFIPVVGQLYDVADVISIAMTGEDLLGAKRSETDILMIAAFGLLGGFGDIARGAKGMLPDLGIMRSVSEKLFPTAMIVSKNPNLVPGFLRASFHGSNPALRHAAWKMAENGGDARYLRKMDGLLKAGDSKRIREFGDDFAATLYATMRKVADTVPFERQPAILDILFDQQEAFLKSAAIKAMPKEAQIEIAEAFAKGRKAGDMSGVFAAVAKADPAAGKLLQNHVLDTVKLRLESHPSITRRLTAYRRRKGKENTDALTYITKHATGEAREVFELTYGVATLAALKGGKTRMTPEEILLQPGYIDEVKRLMNDINTYYKHRAHVEEKWPGIGRILNSDHLLERRFRKVERVEGSLDDTMFYALTVPANDKVAAILKENGIDTGWYIHTHKTRRMDEILPQNREGEFTVKNIADAYQYFWVHEMGMSHKMFSDIFAIEFHHLALAKAGKLTDASAGKFGTPDMMYVKERTKEELMRSMRRFRRRMELNAKAQQQVGDRMTTAPGQ